MGGAKVNRLIKVLVHQEGSIEPFSRAVEHIVYSIRAVVSTKLWVWLNFIRGLWYLYAIFKAPNKSLSLRDACFLFLPPINNNLLKNWLCPSACCFYSCCVWPSRSQHLVRVLLSRMYWCSFWYNRHCFDGPVSSHAFCKDTRHTQTQSRSERWTFSRGGSQTGQEYYLFLQLGVLQPKLQALTRDCKLKTI